MSHLMGSCIPLTFYYDYNGVQRIGVGSLALVPTYPRQEVPVSEPTLVDPHPSGFVLLFWLCSRQKVFGFRSVFLKFFPFSADGTRLLPGGPGPRTGTVPTYLASFCLAKFWPIQELTKPRSCKLTTFGCHFYIPN